MVYSFAVHDTEPEQFVIHVVEEAAHRLRDAVNLKIDPKRIKNLALGPEASLEQVQIAVAHLDRWRGSAAQWMHDVEWQKWLQR
ncbi:hypothetical protein RS694_02620 [Rhodoferax saidenbachensis]|uniref:Uncharacterized protein n=2 Tax=Rhodoferax saidenbachensis TaxID=1484693 RepID=A0A1P8K6J1_9BURK|nr:hypothetical protein RS694_02620 [Rhodoferax saidenbachensis]